MRLIPKKTKVQIEIFRGISILDMAVGAVFVSICIAVALSDLPGKYVFDCILLCCGIILLCRAGEEPIYSIVFHCLLQLFSPKNYAKNISDSFLYFLHENRQEVRSYLVQQLFDDDAIEEMDVPDNLKNQMQEQMLRRQNRRKAEEELLKSDAISQDEKQQIKEKHHQEDMENFFRPVKHTDEKHLQGTPMKNIIPYTSIQDNLIRYGSDYYASVLEIPSVEFRFFSEARQNASIEGGLGQVLRNLSPELGANIVKLERPVQYQSHKREEYRKLDELHKEYEKGFITEAELKARVEIVYDRINELRELDGRKKVIDSAFYLVLFASDKRQLEQQTKEAIGFLQGGEMNPIRLDDRGLAIFLKYSNSLDFDENRIDILDSEEYVQWCQPETVSFHRQSVRINNIIAHNMMVTGYPIMVGNSWMASVLSIPATKVVIKVHPMDRQIAVRSIDRTLEELRSQYVGCNVDSRKLELGQHIETLQQLLNTLQDNNEVLLNTNIYVTAYDIVATREEEGTKTRDSWLCSIANMKKQVRRIYSEKNIKLSNMQFRQFQAFEGGQISAYDPMWKKGQGIPSNSLAAAYPWIFAHIRDDNGIKLGSSDNVPVFVNFFQRDYQRVNSNIVIVGKTGSGKSYAAKSLLANLAADDSKIFVLDPENEYAQLAENLHGKFINVGNANQGRINPFHIITDLEDDDTEGGQTNSYLVHLQFLEEFFRQIMPDCDAESLDYLNKAVDKLYAGFGIGKDTNLSMLKAEDYPTFDDLHEFILHEYQTNDNAYLNRHLRILVQQVEKFAEGGRNANLWNGSSTITTEENFTVFNFQNLLANRNSVITNAQMLLVLKYIDNEIIKNRDYNIKYNANRKIIVVVDEAHIFIDEKYPIALDFMYQLAKRIRKYNGMQVVITQNIKDFTGNEEISRKSSAIINACQYSLIFSLAPNDMRDLCVLYEKAGGINEQEQEQIISAPRGQVFAVIGPQSRTSFRVEVPEQIRRIFQEKNIQSFYFSGANGEENWLNFLKPVGEVKILTEGSQDNITKQRENQDQEELPNLRRPGQICLMRVTNAGFLHKESTLLEQRRNNIQYLSEQQEDEQPILPDTENDSTNETGSTDGGIEVKQREDTAERSEIHTDNTDINPVLECIRETMGQLAATIERINSNNISAIGQMNAGNNSVIEMLSQLLEAKLTSGAVQSYMNSGNRAVQEDSEETVFGHRKTDSEQSEQEDETVGSRAAEEVFDYDSGQQQEKNATGNANEEISDEVQMPQDEENKEDDEDDEEYDGGIDDALLDILSRSSASETQRKKGSNFVKNMRIYNEERMQIDLKDIKAFLDDVQHTMDDETGTDDFYNDIMNRITREESQSKDDSSTFAG